MWSMWCLLILSVNLYGTEATKFSRHSLRPSQQKCQEYIREIENRQYEGMNQKPSPLRFSQRRHKHFRPKHSLGIHNGKRTLPMEYPHMGALGWYSLIKQDWQFQCGASLISSNFLLTAAHCTKIAANLLTEFDTAEPKIVRLGARNIRKSDYEISRDFDIDQIKVHEKYISPNHYYDIALLKLSRHVHFTNFIHPACLGVIPARHRNYTVTGWGITARCGKMVDDLRYGVVDLIEQNKCDFYIRPHRSRNWKKRAPHQICAGKMDGSFDTCNGDSGGPLQYKLLNTTNESSIHAIIGITAFGSTRCATKNLPSLYTKVEFFIPWIENIVWPSKTRAEYNKNINMKRYSLHDRRRFNNTQF